MPKVISSFKVFEETFSGNPILTPGRARLEALKRYFEFGGVVSLGSAERGWPELVYPSKLKIKDEIKKFSAKRGEFASSLSAWEKKLGAARTYHLRHNIIKFSKPLYWRHKLREFSDKAYRKDAASVKLPAYLAADPRWEPMIKTFLNDEEYRKQLTETVENSLIYGNDRRVARYATTLQDFRADISGKKAKEYRKKVNELNTRISTLNALLKWANE